MKDCIPTLTPSGNFRYEDLKIVDFIMYRPKSKALWPRVPVYILTDRVTISSYDYYVTKIRIGFIEQYIYLDYQDACYTKLEAYKQHKMIYKKLMNGFFDTQIKKIIDESWVTCKND